MVQGSFLKHPTFNNPQLTERVVFFLQSKFQNLGPVLLIRSEKTFNHLLRTRHHPFGEADLSETNAAHRGSVSSVFAEDISTQIRFFYSDISYHIKITVKALVHIILPHPVLAFKMFFPSPLSFICDINTSSQMFSSSES